MWNSQKMVNQFNCLFCIFQFLALQAWSLPVLMVTNVFLSDGNVIRIPTVETSVMNKIVVCFSRVQMVVMGLEIFESWDSQSRVSGQVMRGKMMKSKLWVSRFNQYSDITWDLLIVSRLQNWAVHTVDDLGTDMGLTFEVFVLIQWYIDAITKAVYEVWDLPRISVESLQNAC